jgi:ParB family chromosome partitioning protein
MSQNNKKDALGQGIRSLLRGIDEDLKSTSNKLQSEAAGATATLRIPIDSIEVNPKQPRKDFDQQALQELSASIRLHGIIQPVTVSKLPSGKYRLIAGERRLRASGLAGMKDIPAFIRQANDNELLELALLENLQRENLNPMEIAMSYQRLEEELDYTQEQVAERMGKSRSDVANYLRLLKLPPDIQLALRNEKITKAHGIALLSLDEIDRQLYVFKTILDKDLSVKQTEALIRQFKKQKSGKKNINQTVQHAFRKIEDKLAETYGTRVHLKHQKNGTGSITIDYYSLEQLNHLLRQMNVPVE